MEFKVSPNYTINRAGHKVVADENGIIKTDIPEIVEVISFLTKSDEAKEHRERKRNKYLYVAPLSGLLQVFANNIKCG